MFFVLISNKGFIMQKQRFLLLVFGFITILILLFPPFIFKDTGQINNEYDSDENRTLPSFEKYDFLFLPTIQNVIKNNVEYYKNFDSEADGSYLYKKENIRVVKIEKINNYYSFIVQEPNIRLMERHLSFAKFLGTIVLDFFVFGFIMFFIRNNSKLKT